MNEPEAAFHLYKPFIICEFLTVSLNLAVPASFDTPMRLNPALRSMLPIDPAAVPGTMMLPGAEVFMI